jgi:hypothetical protein
MEAESLAAMPKEETELAARTESVEQRTLIVDLFPIEEVMGESGTSILQLQATSGM